MRVLLDESLPRQLANEFTGHQVRTVGQQGWQGMKNGELLRRAGAERFDVFVTADQNLEYQQNLSQSSIGIVVIAAKTNRIEDLRPLVPNMLRALTAIEPGRITRVSV